MRSCVSGWCPVGESLSGARHGDHGLPRRETRSPRQTSGWSQCRVTRVSTPTPCRRRSRRPPDPPSNARRFSSRPHPKACPGSFRTPGLCKRLYIRRNLANHPATTSRNALRQHRFPYRAARSSSGRLAVMTDPWLQLLLDEHFVELYRAFDVLASHHELLAATFGEQAAAEFAARNART